MLSSSNHHFMATFVALLYKVQPQTRWWKSFPCKYETWVLSASLKWKRLPWAGIDPWGCTIANLFLCMWCNFLDLEECHLSSFSLAYSPCVVADDGRILPTLPHEAETLTKDSTLPPQSQESLWVKEQCVFLWPCVLVDDGGWETAGEWLGGSYRIPQYQSHGAPCLTGPHERGFHLLAPRSNLPINWKNMNYLG